MARRDYERAEHRKQAGAPRAFAAPAHNHGQCVADALGAATR